MTESRRPFTEDEKLTIALLVDAWNTFLKLPVEHGDDVNEFRSAVHKAQMLVLYRGHNL